MNNIYTEGSRPVNLTAARVIYADKEVGSSSPKTGNVRWQTPPDTVSAENKIFDFTGMVLGRLRVIGLLPKIKRRERNRAWLVKCACGWYELRRSKTLMQKKDPDDCCQECRHVKYLKSHYEYISYFNRTGCKLNQESSLARDSKK